ISHRLAEVFRISSRITVLRDGRSVGCYNASAVTPQRVVALMVGREISEVFPERRFSAGETVLEVRNLTAISPQKRKPLLQDVSFSVRRGEVLGIAGLMGAGRSESLLAIFGALPRARGEILVNGRAIRLTSPADAIA